MLIRFTKRIECSAWVNSPAIYFDATLILSRENSKETQWESVSSITINKMISAKRERRHCWYRRFTIGSEYALNVPYATRLL